MKNIWTIITTNKTSKKVPATLLKGLTYCQLSKDTVAVLSLGSSNDILNKNVNKLKRECWFSFAITDKQFGLIGKKIPNWKGLEISTDNGIMSVTHLQAQQPIILNKYLRNK